MTSPLDNTFGEPPFRSINPEELSISIDIQQYVDQAVTSLHKQVSSQVESNLNALLKEAFMLTIEPLRLQPVVADGLWHSFLQKLALSAEMAVDEIEDRK